MSLDRTVFALDESATARDNESLPRRVSVPRGPRGSNVTLAAAARASSSVLNRGRSGRLR
ncbi:hypothetical protein [Haladaptatus sp. DYF46]|uniref:hypothetical protein n=1 Tax=Haladaptatus sp. DYF46 TaxID=2886041 RepID=UPI001E58FB22|nr:hypothetical protein [Haladaptatus sp. DYF46]